MQMASRSVRRAQSAARAPSARTPARAGDWPARPAHQAGCRPRPGRAGWHPALGLLILLLFLPQGSWAKQVRTREETILRERASPSAPVIGRIKARRLLQVLEEPDVLWMKVRFRGKVGWVRVRSVAAARPGDGVDQQAPDPAAPAGGEPGSPAAAAPAAAGAAAPPRPARAVPVAQRAAIAAAGARPRPAAAAARTEWRATARPGGSRAAVVSAAPRPATSRRVPPPPAPRRASAPAAVVRSQVTTPQTARRTAQAAAPVAAPRRVAAPPGQRPARVAAGRPAVRRPATGRPGRVPGWGDGGPARRVMRVVVSAERVQAFTDPRADTRVVFQARAGDELAVIANGGQHWLLVESPQGKVGWISSLAVRDRGVLVNHPALGRATPVRPARPTPIAAPPAPAPAGQETGLGATTAAAPPASRGRRLQGHASAGLGLNLLRLSSQPDVAAAAFDASATSATAVLSGDVSWRVAGRLHLAADGQYQYIGGGSGMSYVSQANTVDGISFAMHEFGAGGQLGYGTERMAVRGRLGYYQGSYEVTALDNPARLPRERLSGPTVGLRGHFALPRWRLLAGAQADLLFAGKRQQTAGLQEGTAVEESTTGWLGTSLSYHLGQRLTLDASYRFRWSDASWSGPSSRQEGVSSSERSERSQTILLGVGFVL
jgi:SH3-like domain-containing protein